MAKIGTVNGGKREWILCDAKDKAALKLADEISAKMDEFGETYCQTIKCETCFLKLALGYCPKVTGFDSWDRADEEYYGLCLYDEELKKRL